MSITSRIFSMEEHVTNAYDELQGLGADLTNVNKNIENISMVLDDIYDSMPKVSGEGTSLTLDDTRVGKIKSTLKGNTSQSGTPTPSSPIPVNVVSGDNEINVCGKNLFDKSTAFLNKTVTGSGGLIDFTGVFSSDYIKVQPSTDYYVNQYMPAVVAFDKDKNAINYIRNASGSATFTTPNNCEYIRARMFDASIDMTTALNNAMLNLGTSATNYEPYIGNTYNIDLPEGMELCKIGTYQDYFYKDSDKWYLHKRIGKVVLNGSESWSVGGSYQGIYQMQTGKPDVLYYGDDTPRIMSDYFLGIGWGNSWTKDNAIVIGNQIIRIMTSGYSTADAFKAWLSTHNINVYYVLLTTTSTEITYQPLIDQLNELEKAMSKDGQTNISQVNNDLPFIISASALKEWQESTSLNSTLSMVNPLSLGNTLNTQENNTQPIEVDNIEPLEEEENEES